MDSSEEDPFILGQYAGDDFLEKVNVLLKEFKKEYNRRGLNYDFDNEAFVEGFFEAFVSGFDQ